MEKLNYAVEQRLRFIDYLLYRYGHINRHVLREYFGVATATATRDFTIYKKLAPNNMQYSPEMRSYCKTADFETLYNVEIAKDEPIDTASEN